MEALPGAGLGGLYAFVMIMATVGLRLLSRAKILTVTITAKTYLRGSILVTLALCIVVPLIDDTFVATGSWLIFFLTGFHVFVFATSYMEPFNRRPAAESSSRLPLEYSSVTRNGSSCRARSHRAPDNAFIPPCRSLLPC